MKRRLSVIAIILAMDNILTPFSFAIGDDGDVFDMGENVVIENEITESDSSEDIHGEENEIEKEEQESTVEDMQWEVWSEEDSSEDAIDTQENEIDNVQNDNAQMDDSYDDASEREENIQDSSEQALQNDEWNITETWTVEDISTTSQNNESNAPEWQTGNVITWDVQESLTSVEKDDIQTGIENDDMQTGTSLTGVSEVQTWSWEETLQQLIENEEDQEGTWWIIDAVTEEVKDIITKIRYFFKRSWDDRYIKYGRDKNNIWIITLKDPQNWTSITIMDKNLWAWSVWIGRSSYGYYFQWWNNHGVVNTSNRTTTKAVYEDSYYNHGYDGWWVFIVWSTDYWENGNHYNSLWWESKEYARQASCPAWYHVPTIKEWNQLISIWWKIHTQDESKENWTSVLRYSASYATKNIHTFKSAATLCDEWDIDCVDEDKLSSIIEVLSSELKLPLAWSYDENGNFQEWIWVYWTATPKDGNKAWVFSVETYIWEREDETLFYKAQWHNIRCFQDVEKMPEAVEAIVEPELENTQETEDVNTWDVVTWDIQDSPDDVLEWEMWSGEVSEQNIQEWEQIVPEQQVWWEESNPSLIENDNHVGGGESVQNSSSNSISESQKEDVLTWEEFTWSAIDLLKEWVEENIEEIEISKEQELAKIWETLNEDRITWLWIFKNVIVNVEAPENSFPEWTELRITPITAKAQMEEIKEQLVENTDVTEDSELVSFDISFIYTLSGWEEIELQPYTWKTVKVSFNYTYNDTLKGADSDDNKELKVYHLEEIVDEEWNKTDEVEVKEMDINENASSEWKLVIDAEKFSTYTIVTQQSEEPQNTNTWVLWTDYQLIVQQNPNDTSQCITIMDRNLWATSDNISITDSYGYYYQRWNNYWFTFDSAKSTKQKGSTNVWSPDPGEYSDKHFHNATAWMSSFVNLWWWEHFSSMPTTVSAWSLPSNYGERQWPCPNWWHVPSAYEFSLLIEYWANENHETLWSMQYGLNKLGSSEMESFREKFKIPQPGRLQPKNWNSNPTEQNKWYQFYIWLSSANGSRPLRFSDESSTFYYEYPGYWSSVRCMRDWYSCVTEITWCNLPWWWTVEHWTTVTWYQSASVPYGQSCVSTGATCNNGTWSVANFTGNYQYSWCEVQAPANCSFQWQTILHGSGLTVYSTSSTTCPTTCTSWTVTCNNGTVSWNTGYTNLSCSPTAVSCDASFTLSSTGSNWTYSSCTPYTASSNTCNPWTTVYKLTNCDTNYHTEDNATCTGNSKQVACTQSWKPTNSEYVPWNVTVTWNGTWNNGSWTTADNCDWTCNAHYHLNQAEDGCDIDTFVITWIDWDWHILTTGEVDYNTTPTYSGPTPTKTSTEQYSYSFDGVWSPAIVPATEDATYTAQFSWILNPYTATIEVSPAWYGSVNSGSVTKDYWSPISINGNQITIWWTTVTASPTPADAQYTYTFSGWNNTCGNSLITGCIIQAEFERITNEYSIIFKDWDGAVLQSWMVAYGVTPTPPSNPIRGADEQYTYIFDTWSPSISSVTQAQVYTAIYLPKINQYTAIITATPNGYGTVSSWLVTADYWTSISTDGNELTIWSTTVVATPTASGAQYTYTFSGWTFSNCGSSWPEEIRSWCVIMANFDREVNKYTITWKNDDNSILEVDTWVEYWTIPTYDWPVPQKTGSLIYAYAFSGWNPEVSEVHGDQIYTATYRRDTRKYKVTWRNIDGTVLETDNNVAYWSTPEYNGTTPSNWVSNQYVTSTFAWWNPALSPVVKDVEYMARYTYALNSGYVLDTSKDPVNLTLNANWWIFSNNSWYDILNYDYYNRAEKKYSHSSNYSDDWVRNTSATVSDDWQYVTTITWAEYLYLNLTYDLHEILLWLANSSKDKLFIHAWTSVNDELIASLSWNTNAWIQGNVNYIITGDSVLLDFYLANRNISDYESNWFYAVIVWVIPVWYITDDEAQTPTREWYIFDGWYTQVEWWDLVDLTGLVVTGNMEVYAHWTPNTGIQYTVYHYVKRVWENTYALSDTDILSWTTDQVLTLSTLAKESEFMCAHYSSWSLTWTDSWPWEIVTQTTIRWDGSTKIYLYYTRNSHTVYLSGDANVESLKIDGQERSEAVRECWSEVPVNAVPKPWYHFVRWDREENRRSEEEEEEWELPVK